MNNNAVDTRFTGKWAALSLLAASQVAALALWFCATAAVPAIPMQYALTDTEKSLLTSLVSIGFVAGTLMSAVFGVADRVNPRWLFAGGAASASVVNLLLLAYPPNSASVFAARFATGFAIAFVYPVGMKMAASWARGDTGLLVGLLVGALTFGSASPHLFNALGGLEWNLTISAASLSGFASAVLVLFVKLGPNQASARAFQPNLAARAFTQPGLRLANLGYFGHMWELYAMWAWIGVFLVACFDAAKFSEPKTAASLATFAVLAAGAVGSVAAGVLADRLGRTTVTTIAMTISGLCAISIGLAFAYPMLVITIALVWGVTVVADSAQFSSSIIELTRPELTGTMLTVQTSVGFLVTLASVHLVPFWVDAWGWRAAFAPLALGPLAGTIAMLRLRLRPEARLLANGRG